MVKTWHFSALNWSSHLSDHFSSIVISRCIFSASHSEPIFRYSFASSANSKPLDSMLSRRSLINMTKSSGPSTDPWGIPLMTAAGIELTPFTFTVCVLPVRKASIQSKIFPVMPYASSLPRSLWWGTVSKAFQKSKYKASTTPPLTIVSIHSSI